MWNRIRDNKSLQAFGAIVGIGQVLISTLTTIISAVGGVAVFEVLLERKQAPLLVAALSVLTCGLIASLIWMLKNIAKVAHSLKEDWNPNILSLRRDIYCILKSRTEIIYKYVYHLQILRDGVDSFNHRVGWSGQGSIEVSVKNPGFTPILQHNSGSLYKRLKIVFEKPMPKGQMKLEFTISTNGNVEEQKPYVACSFIEARVPRAASLTLDYSSLPVRRVWKEVYRRENANTQLIPPEEVLLTAEPTISWPIAPKKRRRYCLCWEY